MREMKGDMLAEFLPLLGEGLKPVELAERVGRSIVERAAASGCEIKLRGEPVLSLGHRTERSLALPLPNEGRLVLFFDSEPGSEAESLARLVAVLIEQSQKINALIVREKEELVEENIELRQVLSANYRFENIVGVSGAMQLVYERIALVSQSNATVLISGETGTGKELVASAIHYNSARANGPFVKVNCGVLPEGLIESELFGHAKGAFTGAIADRKGRFESANGGSLFLDEVGDLPPATQVKVLRFLQEREFERVGDSRTVKADVRIIAATNRALDEEVAAGRFREDLYFRLNVIPIHIPPLRERKEDIPLLVDHFLRKYNRQNCKNVWKVSKQTLEAMMSYDWYGNVRELEAYIERAVVLATGEELSAELLPTYVEPDRGADGPQSLAKSVVGEFERACRTGGRPLDQVVSAVERIIVEKALRDCHYNQSEAARRLGLNRNTLHKKIAQYGIATGRNG